MHANTDSKDDAAIKLRGAAGLALGAFEMANPQAVVRADHLDAGAEPLVRLAGLHKAIVGAGLLSSGDARPWLAAALAGSVYDGLALMAKRASPAAFGRLAAVVLVDALLLARDMKHTPTRH